MTTHDTAKDETTADVEAIILPAWVEYFRVETAPRGWLAVVEGDPRGAGDSQRVEAFGDSAGDAARNAFDQAEGWTSFTLERKEPS